MKKILILFIFSIFLSSSFVSAGFSVSSGKLYFNLEQGKEQCQNLVLFSSDYEGPITIRDKWASNSDNSNPNTFSQTSNDLQIKIKHDKKIDNFKTNKDIQICIGSDYSGQRRGIIIFTPESKTNVVVEAGVWLLVNVTGNNPFKMPKQEEKTTSENITTSINETPGEKQNTELSPITGNVTGTGQGRSWIIIISAFALIAIVGLVVYIRRRRDPWRKFR